jgi:hypothetical protein
MTNDLRALLSDVAEGKVAPSEAAKLIDGLTDADRPDEAGDAWGAGDVWRGATAAGGPAPTEDPAARGHLGRPGDAESASGHPGPAAGSRPGGQAGAQPGGQAAGRPGPGPTPGVRIVDPGTGTRPPPDGSDDHVDRVVIQASARPLRVVADHSVDLISAEGPHTIRREGGVIRVEAGSQGAAGQSPQAGSYQFERRPTGLSRWLSQASIVGVPLVVRVNPAMRVEVEMMAGTVDLMGLQGPFAFSVTAGSVRTNDCAGPFTGSVRAGSAKLEVRPTSGASAIRVESGSVDLRVLSGSDVRIRARAELGEVKVKGPDGTGRAMNPGGESVQEFVVGNGAATLEVDAVMGSIKVRVP